jgi:hypothetical protein
MDDKIQATALEFDVPNGFQSCGVGILLAIQT